VIVVGNVPIAVHVLEITAALELMEIVVPEKTAIHVMDVIAARVREETERFRRYDYTPGKPSY